MFQHAGLSSTQPENTSPGALGNVKKVRRSRAVGKGKSEEQEAVKKADRAGRAEEERPGIAGTTKYKKENAPNSNFC